MKKLKQFWAEYGSETYIIVCFILVGFISFFFGRLSVAEPKTEIVRSYNLEPEKVIESSTTQQREVGVVHASRNGTRYYYNHCSGKNRIKEENLIYFNSANEAEDSGYSLAKACE